MKIEDTSLVIEEIPFEVNKSELVRKIDDIRIKRKIDGILEVKDMSDRDGLSIVITLKKEIPSDVILAYLFKNTDLKVTFNYNMVAICQRSPKLLSLVEIMDEFIQHQKEVIRNRSNFELRKAEKRKHIVLGFLNMVDVLDEVIAVIRQSLGKKDAINALINTFNFTEVQADAIVSLQLYRLSTTDVSEMRKEAAELTKLINRLQKILTNESELEAVIINELEEILELYPVKRKTEIQDEVERVEIDEQELIENEEVKFVISKDGYIKRSSLKSFQATQSETGLKENDLVLKQCTLNTRDQIIIFTNYGNFILLPAYKVPDLKWRDNGEYISNFAHLEPSEKVVDFLVVKNFDTEKAVLLANQEGQIKQVMIEEFSKTRINRTYNCIPASKINPLVSVDLREEYDRDIVLATENGYLLKYSYEEVPVQSLNAKGVKGINLRDDKLVSAKYTTHINKDEVIFLTNRGGLIREFTQNIDTSHRPAKGKLRLKAVKSNPYKFVGMISENIFRLKEFLSIRIIGETAEVIVPAEELKPDRYEYGIPYIPQSKKPILLLVDKDNVQDADEILNKLAVSIEEEEDVVDDNQDVLYELEKIISSAQQVEEPETEEDDEDLDSARRLLDEDEDEEEYEIEDKNYSTDYENSNNDEDDEDDLDEAVVQQTLF